MAELCDFNINRAGENLWSEEHDLVPLKQRLKLLLAKNKLQDATERVSNDANVKREDEDLESQVTHSACETWEGMSDGVSSEESNHGEPEECNRTEIGTNDKEDLTTMEFTEVDADNVRLGKVSGTVGSSLQHTGLSQYPVKLEPENTDYILLSSVETCLTKASNGNVQECAISTESHEVFLDDLDHVVLKERQKMLLSRRALGFIKPAMEGNKSGLSDSAAFLIQHRSVIGNEENIFDGKDFVMGASHLHAIADENASGLIKSSSVDTSHGPALTHNCQETTSSASGISASMHEHCSGNNFLSGNQMTDLRPALPIFANVKAEPMDSSELQIPSKEALDNSSTAALPVKCEVGITDESLDDKLDHMLLQERMILRASKGIPSPAINGTHFFSRKVGSSSFDYNPAGPQKPLRMKRPRKKRKTATDSVETAMEEDAPGLLQVLIEKGVLLDEIKLYDEMESDEVLDDSLTENSFAELEAVITKLFSQRQSLLKFAPIRCGKAERASYCLSCLISLVEQARYLQFRKWPVEWGWCRDLQSFIFVFERHNRIVLERPEYGYATYFFELVDSLPIQWQLKRLVIAMKLTSCSRVTLLENRALTVGDDLTEEEARVLMNYGWAPDSGLGTMLNYCDRVVHDRKNEKDSSEWRTKIGKLLVDGYNGGTIVSSELPKHVIEHGDVQSQEIKLEL